MDWGDFKALVKFLRLLNQKIVKKNKSNDVMVSLEVSFRNKMGEWDSVILNPDSINLRDKHQEVKRCSCFDLITINLRNIVEGA